MGTVTRPGLSVDCRRACHKPRTETYDRGGGQGSPRHGKKGSGSVVEVVVSVPERRGDREKNPKQPPRHHRRHFHPRHHGHRASRIERGLDRNHLGVHERGQGHGQGGDRSFLRQKLGAGPYGAIRTSRRCIRHDGRLCRVCHSGKRGHTGSGRIHLCAQWGKMLKIAMAIPQTHVRHGAIDLKKTSGFPSGPRIPRFSAGELQYRPGDSQYYRCIGPGQLLLPLLKKVCTAAGAYAGSLAAGYRCRRISSDTMGRSSQSMDKLLTILGIGYKPLEPKRRRKPWSPQRRSSVPGGFWRYSPSIPSVEKTRDKLRRIDSVDETMRFIREAFASGMRNCSLSASGDPFFFGIGKRAV